MLPGIVQTENIIASDDISLDLDLTRLSPVYMQLQLMMAANHTTIRIKVW
jgi:hypothetical protein